MPARRLEPKRSVFGVRRSRSKAHRQASATCAGRPLTATRPPNRMQAKTHGSETVQHQVCANATDGCGKRCRQLSVETASRAAATPRAAAYQHSPYDLSLQLLQLVASGMKNVAQERVNSQARRVFPGILLHWAETPNLDSLARVPEASVSSQRAALTRSVNKPCWICPHSLTATPQPQAETIVPSP